MILPEITEEAELSVCTGVSHQGATERESPCFQCISRFSLGVTQLMKVSTVTGCDVVPSVTRQV